ncbi:MAG: hypothetical protein JAY74_25715 [Candidatus Thiodiazotropha taylori]|nr:hypothetical protein [Candidatus Thiodiazotropha taylori]
MSVSAIGADLTVSENGAVLTVPVPGGEMICLVNGDEMNVPPKDAGMTGPGNVAGKWTDPLTGTGM